MIHRNASKQSYRELTLVAALLMLSHALPGTIVPAQSTAASATSIENFGKVNDNYYRGSQPTEEQIAQLNQLGIKTIIDLRRDKKPREGEWASRAGMQYFNIPLKASQAATEEQTAFFLSLVSDPTKWPVYVHCKGGRHRTGALTAAYRITHDGWTAEQAFREMKKYDFDDNIFGGPAAQKKYVFSFYEHYVALHSSK